MPPQKNSTVMFILLMLWIQFLILLFEFMEWWNVNPLVKSKKKGNIRVFVDGTWTQREREGRSGPASCTRALSASWPERLLFHVALFTTARADLSSPRLTVTERKSLQFPIGDISVSCAMHTDRGGRERERGGERERERERERELKHLVWFQGSNSVYLFRFFL